MSTHKEDRSEEESEVKNDESVNVDPFLGIPVHEQSWRFLLSAIPKRIVGLISKGIGIKMAMFALATVIFVFANGVLPWYAWVILYIVTIFGRDALKYIDKIKK